MTSTNRTKISFCLWAALFVSAFCLTSCHDRNPEGDDPDPTIGYIVRGDDTMTIFAVCKTQSTATTLDISLSDREDMLFTIFDSQYGENTAPHDALFGINEHRSSTAENDSYDGTLEVRRVDDTYEILFSGFEESEPVTVYYHGPVDEANLPAGIATVTIGGTTTSSELARVFSYDQTYSYLMYASDYNTAVKITSKVQLTEGTYTLTQSALDAQKVKVSVIYFGGQVVNLKPTEGSLTVSRQGGQFTLHMQAPTTKGDMTLHYEGTFNRQCVVDF